MHHVTYSAHNYVLIDHVSDYMRYAGIIYLIYNVNTYKFITCVTFLEEESE
ncbi:hypothetical protein GCM10026983_44400 [Gracilibacillus alcaliphilus]